MELIHPIVLKLSQSHAFVKSMTYITEDDFMKDSLSLVFGLVDRYSPELDILLPDVCTPQDFILFKKKVDLEKKEIKHRRWLKNKENRRLENPISKIAFPIRIEQQPLSLKNRFECLSVATGSDEPMYWAEPISQSTSTDVDDGKHKGKDAIDEFDSMIKEFAISEVSLAKLDDNINFSGSKPLLSNHRKVLDTIRSWKEYPLDHDIKEVMMIVGENNKIQLRFAPTLEDCQKVDDLLRMYEELDVDLMPERVRKQILNHYVLNNDDDVEEEFLSD
jgi:hypothetical protein